MKRGVTLPAFTPEEKQQAHQLLATRVAFMNGRKFEEGDWSAVYCGAKGIPPQKWSNLEIDVMHGSLGVEHKMLCYRSGVNLLDACGKTLMHPAATRSIRIASVEADPQTVRRDVLTQYAQLIKAREKRLRERTAAQQPVDLRTGWLLWQESLRQFLYFEEKMVPPRVGDYEAKWVESNSGTRKGSKNLWVYERKTGIKRFSITTQAGAKVQPYFDVPPPTDPNLNLFTVIGEMLDTGFVRVWLTEATLREIRQLAGSLETTALSQMILQKANSFVHSEQFKIQHIETAESVLVTNEAYQALLATFPGVNDDHCFRLLAQALRQTQ
jgi:hypothetical protein